MDTRELDQILNDIKLSKKMNHKNINKFHEAFTSSNRIYKVTQKIEGSIELFEYILNLEKFSESEVCKIMQKLLKGIEYMHSKGMIHRDIKPEGISVFIDKNCSKDMQVQFTNFGQSCYDTDVHQMKQVVGTSYYIAPEVLNRKFSNKCDLWSLGVLLYILITGNPPFHGNTHD